MTTENLTWPKAKDAILVGMVGIMVTIGLKILVDVTEIRERLARVEAIEKRVEHLERAVEGRK